MQTATSDAPDGALNLPGLLRAAYNLARERGQKNVTIIIPEKNKDQYIYALSDTKFAQEQELKIVPIPIELRVYDTTIALEVSENVEEGEVII